MQNATMTFTLTGPDPLIFGMWRDLDARGHRIKNLADAVDDQDAVTLKQMQDAIGGGSGGGGGGGTPNFDAQTLQGNNAAFFRNADNINAGTLNVARLPAASTTARGIVQLSASITSASATTAATSSAVKAVADALVGYAPKASTLAGYGITDAYTKAQTDKAIQDAALAGGGSGAPETGSSILDKLKTVDGKNSGLDTDLFQGKDIAYFLDITDLGVAEGVAPLNNAGKIDVAYLDLPDALQNKAPARYDQTDARYGSKLFQPEGSNVFDIGAYKLDAVYSPFNPNYDAGNYVAHHIRHVAEGTNKNGPRGAALGLGISMSKAGFGTGNAKGGEIDGLYIVLDQDSPRVNAAGSTGGTGDIIPDRGDGCGILITARVFPRTGFVGGMEGATVVLAESNAVPTNQVTYQIGTFDTTRGNRSFAYFGNATLGAVTGGLLLSSSEGAGGYFQDFITCSTDTAVLFNVDRSGLVSHGRRLNNGQALNPAVHVGLRSDNSLDWLNAAKSVAILNLDQNGNLSSYGDMNAAAINSRSNIQATGNIIAGKLQANLLRLSPGTAGSQSPEYIAGTFSVGASGRPRYCLANGQAPVFLVTSTS